MSHQVWRWTLEAAEAARISPYVIAGVMAIESRYDPEASSEGGRCYGLMQICPEAARWARVNRYIPKSNILGGAKVLSLQLKRHGGDLRAAVRAYNGKAGNGAYVDEVIKAIAQAERSYGDCERRLKGRKR